MQNIITITLNPAVDISADADRIVAGPKLRCCNQQVDPGGGGVNVSRAIARLGGASTALVAQAGATGRLLDDLLHAEIIDTVAIPTAGLTRQSFAIRSLESGEQFRFVMPGPEWTANEMETLFSILDRYVGSGTLVVLSGSLPPGIAPDVVSRIKARVRVAGGRLLLDTSGAALDHAGRAPDESPTLVLRMDGAEARALAERDFAGPEDLAEFGRRLIDRGVAEHVVLSLGAEGTAGISAAEAFFCSPPKMSVVSAVGAGDSLMGALTLSLARGESFRQAVLRGTAAAAAAVETPATELFDPDRMERICADVAIRDLPFKS